MKISKEEYEELCVMRYQINLIHQMVDYEVVRREARYLEEAQKYSKNKESGKPYALDASINTKDIYNVFGWEMPLEAKLDRDEAKKLIEGADV